MDIYLYSKSPDLSYAATTLADLQALIAALADPADADNAATIARVTGQFPALVQGDTAEPINVYSYDDASGTVSSWITDASTTLSLGLGDADPGGAYAYASTTSFSISGSARVGTLALNTTALQTAMGLVAHRRGAGFYLHLRKSAAGLTETVARLLVTVQAGVLSGSPSNPSAATYLLAADAAAGYVQNLSGITSLTGGGATALDGLVTAGSTAYPVGCVVLLSYGLVSQLWKLVAGTDAEDVSATPAVVRPDDYNASTNAIVWKQIG